MDTTTDTITPEMADRRRALLRRLDAIRDALDDYRRHVHETAGDMPARRCHAALTDVVREALASVEEAEWNLLREWQGVTDERGAL